MSNKILDMAIKELLTFDPLDNMQNKTIRLGNPCKKKIMCIEDNILFNSVIECMQHYNIKYRSTIMYSINKGSICKSLRKTFKLIN